MVHTFNMLNERSARFCYVMNDICKNTDMDMKVTTCLQLALTKIFPGFFKCYNKYPIFVKHLNTLLLSQ